MMLRLSRNPDRPSTHPSRTLPLVLLAVAFGAPEPGRAEEPLPDLTRIGIEAVMDMEVTSVSKKPERRMDAPAGIFVLTSEAIRRSGATSIPELLRLVPGVQVARIDSNKWAVGVRGFTSRLSRSLLVLIDGRSVYSPLFAGVYWEVQDVLLEDIDRIEVIRGPGGTLWGANAVNGVINIITREAARSQGGFVAAGGGDEERGSGAARFGGTTPDGTAYRAYARFDERDAGHHAATPDFDGWWMGRAGFRADAAPGAGGTFTLQGDVYAARTGQRTGITTYTAPYTATLLEDSDLTGGNVLGRWRRPFAGGSALTLQAYYDRTRRIDPNFSEERDTFDLDLQGRLRPAGRHDVLWGFGTRWTRDRTEAVPTIRFDPSDRADAVLSAFVQDEIALRPGKAALTIGSKLEHNDYSGFEYQPNVRLLLTPTPRQVVWSAVSRALRVPSRIEHDVEITALLEPATPTFIRILGTDDFRPERLLAYEAGYRAQVSDRFFLDGTAFHYDYDDLLSLEPGTPFTESDPPPDHDVVPVQIRNAMTARVRGAEIVGHFSAPGPWRLSGSYSFLDLDLRPEPGSLDAGTEPSTEGNSPRHLAGLRLSADLPGRIDLDATIRYVGRLPAQDVDSYTELDLRLGWRTAAGLELSLSGRNLLSARHPEFGAGGGVLVEVERSLFATVIRRW